MAKFPDNCDSSVACERIGHVTCHVTYPANDQPIIQYTWSMLSLDYLNHGPRDFHGFLHSIYL